jgi:hypothetical protein
VLAEPVFAGGRNKPFGELTRQEVASRAQELSQAAGWGPTARVAPVARAWRELAREMDERGVETVAALGAESARERAERLWVVPPGGSLL